MKRLVAALACGATLAAVFPADTVAQAQQAARQAASTAPAKSPPPAPAKRRPWTHADARVCLEFPTNVQIIRCAEKYRHMRAPA